MSLSTTGQTILILLAIFLAYIWISTPFLTNYSLQAFALSAVIYLFLKKKNSDKIWYLVPKHMSLEMIIASFAFLMLIGATGNKDSIFYPLTYVHLFFLVFATEAETAIIITGALMLFHYALGIELNLRELADLLTLPLMMSIFLFTKIQYQDILHKTAKIEKEEKIIKKENSELISFIERFLKPKLNQLKQELRQDQMPTNQVDQINKAVSQLEEHVS